MTQTEINKNAVASVMALEDAKGIYEAIAELNDDFSGMPVDDGQMEYSADDLMAVNPMGNNDQMGMIPDLSGAGDDMDEETQKFVVDRFAEMAANLPGDTIDMSDITPIATVIKEENGIKQDVNGYLEKIMMAAANRLSQQNVSEAQPNGTAVDFSNDETAGIGSDMDAFGGFDSIGGGMEEAPGGVGEEPSLQANMGEEEPSFDGIGDGLGAEDADLGLDGGLGAEGEGEGALGAEEGAGEGAEFDADAVNGVFDESMGEGEPEGGFEGEGEGELEPFGEGEGEGEGTQAIGDEEMGFGETPESGAEEIPADAGDGDAEMGEEMDDGFESDEAFEANMNNAKAQLESIRGKYIQDRAASKIRSIVESFQARKNSETKKAKLESIVKNYKKSEASKAAAAADKAVNAKLESIVQNYAKSVSDNKVQAQLEAIVRDYHTKESNRKRAAFEAAGRLVRKENSERALKAKLESISGAYHAGIRKKAQTKAKLESIVNDYRNSAEFRALHEGASKKDSGSLLQEKLDKIIDSVK